MRLGPLVPIIGIILLVSGLTLSILPTATFNQIASSVGLTTTILRSTGLVPPTPIKVPVSNYSYVSFALRENTIVTGNYTVLLGEKVSIIGFNKTGFEHWVLDQPNASLLFYTSPSMNGTFSYRIEQNNTYYFVFINSGEIRSTVIFSMNEVEEIQQASADATSIVQGIIVIGLVLALLGIELEIRHRRGKRLKEQQAEFDRLERVATSLGILSDGKTVEQLRKEIKFELSKQEQQQK